MCSFVCQRGYINMYMDIIYSERRKKSMIKALQVHVFANMFLKIFKPSSKYSEFVCFTQISKGWVTKFISKLLTKKHNWLDKA